MYCVRWTPDSLSDWQYKHFDSIDKATSWSEFINKIHKETGEEQNAKCYKLIEV